MRALDEIKFYKILLGSVKKNQNKTCPAGEKSAANVIAHSPIKSALLRSHLAPQKTA
jgi:hypothetical protein